MRRELVTGCAVTRYEQFDTSPDTIEHELCPLQFANIDRQTDRLNTTGYKTITRALLRLERTINLLCH